jgi:hypothetical protein
MLFEFPTKEDWRALASTVPFADLQVHVDEFEFVADKTEGFDIIFGKSQVPIWIMNLQNRLADVYQSCLMLLFYYDLGIPDDEWYISPGKNGASVEYLPHFDQRHHKIKGQFDFYTDIFYYKSFSAWEAVGQLLFTIYQLKLKSRERISFKLAIDKLRTTKPTLNGRLEAIRKDVDFVLANSLRDDIAHNYQPHAIGFGMMTRFKDGTAEGITGGVGEYTPSSVVKKNVLAVLKLLAETIRAVREQNAEDVA